MLSAASTPAPNADRLQLIVLPQAMIQTIMQFLDLPDKLALASQSKLFRQAAMANRTAWLNSEPVPLLMERVLSPAFSTSVFRYVPWRLSNVESSISYHKSVDRQLSIEAALARVDRVSEVRWGEGLAKHGGGNIERDMSSGHNQLQQQEFLWRCVSVMPTLQALEKLVVCSSLAPMDMCARLRHLNALHTLHVDAGYDRTCYAPDEPFSLSGVDQLPALTDLSYSEPEKSSLYLLEVARCAKLRKLCVLGLWGPGERLREVLTSPGLMRVNCIHLGFYCGYSMSELVRVVDGLPNLTTLTVMSEPTAELFRTLAGCQRLTHLLLQGSSLGCHMFGNVMKKLMAKVPAPHFHVRVERVRYEPSYTDQE